MRCRGRGIGTEGLRPRAAEFLAERFNKLGLRTDLAGGAFILSQPCRSPRPNKGVDWKTIDQAAGRQSAKIAEKSPRSEVGKPAEATKPMRQPVEVKNVVAMLEGEGPRADEVIVVGRPLRPLGMRLKGEQPVVFNGQTTTRRERRPYSSRGSCPSGKRNCRGASCSSPFPPRNAAWWKFYYVKHPLLPLEKTVAMVNLDMVGCIEGDAVMASGSATSKLLTKMVGRAAHEHGLNLIELPGNIGGSDHIPFYTHEVPVVHWMTTGGRLHYHRPSDDLETLDCGGIARIAAMAADLVVELAEAEERPEYKDSGWGGTIIRNVIRLMGSAASAMAEPRQ